MVNEEVKIYINIITYHLELEVSLLISTFPSNHVALCPLA